MDKKKIWDIVKLIFKLSVTILLIYFVFQKIDFKQLRIIFFQSNPWLIFVAFVLLIASQVVSSWRLKGFLHAGDMPISFASNLRLYFLGLFYNSFLPGGIGGDAYKIFLLKKKYQKPTRQILLSILLDRFSGLWAICLLAIIFLIALPVSLLPNYLIILVFTLGSVIYFFLNRHFFPSYARYTLAGHLKAIAAQTLQVISIMMILWSQHFSGDHLPYLFSFLLSSIATAVPVSIGGVGIREYVMMNLANSLHFDAARAVFTTLTFYVLSLLVSIPGIWYSLKKNEWEVSNES